MLSDDGHPAMLSHLARVHREDESACERLALNPACDDPIDNVFYVSEVPPAQWAFEQHLSEAIAKDEELARKRDVMREQYGTLPQAMTHLGVAFPSVEQLDATVKSLGEDPALAGRIELSKVYRPGGGGDLDDRIVQTFVQTDICSNGLLCVGQRFELQVRLDC